MESGHAELSPPQALVTLRPGAFPSQGPSHQPEPRWKGVEQGSVRLGEQVPPVQELPWRPVQQRWNRRKPRHVGPQRCHQYKPHMLHQNSSEERLEKSEGRKGIKQNPGPRMGQSIPTHGGMVVPQVEEERAMCQLSEHKQVDLCPAEAVPYLGDHLRVEFPLPRLGPFPRHDVRRGVQCPWHMHGPEREEERVSPLPQSLHRTGEPRPPCLLM